MANEKMKKAVAMTLAMAMCWSTLSVQAFAAEVNEQAANSGAAESAIVASVNGDTTVTGAGTAESPKLTVTVTTEKNGNTTTTTTTSEWNGQTPLPKEESVPSEGEDAGESQTPSDDQKSEATTTTTVTGSETKVETETVDGANRPIEKTGDIDGEETTTTVTNKTESSEKTVENSGSDSFDPWSNPTFTETPTAEGDAADPVVPVLPDPLGTASDANKVVLELTPGQRDEEGNLIEVVVPCEVREITLENATMYDLTKLDQLKDANKVVIREGNDPNGRIVEIIEKTDTGYKITTYERSNHPQDDEIVRTGDWGTPTDVEMTEYDLFAWLEKNSETKSDLESYAKNEDGSYTLTSGNTTSQIEKTGAGYKVTETTTGESAVLAERTLGTTKTTENGVTTTVTVEAYTDKEGKPGYKTTTVKTKNGVAFYNATKTEVALNETTIQSITTLTAKDWTKVETLSQSSISDAVKTETTLTNGPKGQLIQTPEGVFYVYSATMGEVTCTSTNQEIFQSMMPDSNLGKGDGWKSDGTDIQGHGDTTKNYSWYLGNGGTKPEDSYTQEELKAISDGLDPGQFQFALVGYGLLSEYNLIDDIGIPHLATQYRMIDANGNSYYGYCVEIGKGLSWGGGNGVYTEQNIGDLTGDNTYFLNQSVVYSKLSSVATNGYWGQIGDSQGSLNAVRSLLTDKSAEYTAKANSLQAELSNPSLSAEEKAAKEAEIAKLRVASTNCTEAADNITEGQAMAATQAAIWKYGNSGQNETSDGRMYKFDDLNAVVEYGWNGTTIAEKGRYDDADDNVAYKYIEALYDALIDEAENGTAEVIEEITADDLTGATIVLNSKTEDKSKYTDSEGKEISTENDIFNADLSFVLEVSEDSFGNGTDLTVNVVQKGKIIRSVKLEDIADTTTANSYTVKNVELAEGLEITLNLSGTQYLANGVYVYTCENSQNFIGLASKEHEVDLSVNMQFNVEEPTVETTKKTGTLTEKRTGKSLSSKRVVYADVDITETEVTEREWTEDWEETFTYPSNNKPEVIIPENTPTDPVDPVDPVIPDEPTPETPVDPEIPEEPVPEAPVEIPDETPLADVPKTGDISALWYGLTLLSGGGLLGLFTGRKGKEEQ